MDRHKLLVLAALAVIMAAGISSSATYIVSSKYLTDYSIQNAIKGAHDGDRIIVKSGVYRENVNVTKRLILIGVDTGGGIPIVDAGDKRSAITLMADGVWLQGFHATNSGNGLSDAGIKVLSKENRIRGNQVSNNSYGIYLVGARENMIVDNLANRNDVGIALQASSNNTIRANMARNNSFGGFFLGSSQDNAVSGNTAWQNAWVGIFLSNSTSNLVDGNNATKNDNQGIWLLDSCNNTLLRNTAKDSYISGIRLLNSHYNVLTSCDSSGSLDGLCLETSNNNTISMCNISWTSYGIYLDQSRDNKIFLNNLVKNIYDVYSWNSTNVWNTTRPRTYHYVGSIFWDYLGNYWDDYSGSDKFGSGVGNTTYFRDKVVDFRPLISPFQNYRLLR
ncbi:MAG: right-handed parallel beta-helix repeat-containing protein [Methanotrichaceae archaeon]|nr:right-handed parallel beta-helix repeat-containing protein [Methanotrichaceae archaeon]